MADAGGQRFEAFARFDDPGPGRRVHGFVFLDAAAKSVTKTRNILPPIAQMWLCRVICNGNRMLMVSI